MKRAEILKRAREDKVFYYELVELYQTIHQKKISEILGVSYSSIGNILRDTGIRESFKRDRFSARQNVEVGENPFNNESISSSYLRGYFLADGTVCTNRNAIQISSLDSQIIFDLSLLFKSGFVIKASDREDDVEFTLDIADPKVTDFVLGLGYQRKKSYLGFNGEFPSKYKYAFVRGLFDGDGCFSRKVYFTRFGEEKHSPVFYIQGHISYMTRLKSLVESEVGLNGFLNEVSRDSWRLSFDGREKCSALFGYLYQDREILLKRKFDRWESYLKTGLVEGYKNKVD